MQLLKTFFVFLLPIIFSSCHHEQETSVTVSSAQPETGNIVHLSVAQRQQAGIQVETLQPRARQQTITAPGRIVFNERRLAHLTARVPGRVEQVNAFLGDRVAKDALLATLYSQDYLAAQAEFIQAAERVKITATRPDSSEAATARLILESARQKLRVIGANGNTLAEIINTHIPQTFLEIRAPFAGTVTESNDIMGHYVEVGTTLFHLADISRLWVLADVYAKDLPCLKPGLTAIVEVAAYPNEKFHGELTTVFDVVDEKTQTVKVRLEVQNPTGKLKPNMFATAKILTAMRKELLAVPARAVLGESTKPFVFIALNDTTFERREIIPGITVDSMIEVKTGLQPGVRVVVDGVFELKSELLKDVFTGEE